MTSREIVKRCIEFRDPPRIGLHFHVEPIDGRIWPRTDFGFVVWCADPDFVPPAMGADEWGLARETFDPTGRDMGQVKDHPLAAGWHLLDGYRFPDFSKPARYAHLQAQTAALHAEGRYVYGSIFALMMLSSELRGLENWFMDHLESPENLGRLLDTIVAIDLEIIRQYADAGVDGVIVWDDMGTNDRTLVSPLLFRQIHLPRYRRIIAALHERGMHFIHHCCGQVREYMDDFVADGWDVLQLDQPTLMGIDWLSRHYGGKLCFWNGVDIQKTMPSGDLRAIAVEVRQQVWQLGNFGGGFMVKAYQQPGTVGITAKSFEAQYQAFLKYADYPLLPF